MRAEEVFPCFFAVVFPSEDGGECEEDDADGDDVCAYDADVRGECGDGEFDSLKGCAVGSVGAEDAGGGDGKASNGADNDRIPEGSCHIDVSLTDGVIGGSCSGCDGCRAHACFVGEAASGYAVAHSVHDGDGDATQDAAADCLRVECHHEDEVKSVRNVFNVDEDACHAGYDVEDGHARYDDGGDSGNGLDAADDDGKGHDGQDYAGHFRGYAECGVHGTGDGVRLGHVADAEGSDDCEEGEEEAHDAAEFLILEAVFHGEHRAAFHFAPCVHFAVLDSEHAFREFGCEAEACGDPHPYKRAGAACKHSGRNAYDIACADGSSQGCAKCGERGNIARPFLLAGFFGKHAVKCVWEISPGTEVYRTGQINTGPDEKQEHQRAPNYAVNLADD